MRDTPLVLLDANNLLIKCWMACKPSGQLKDEENKPIPYWGDGLSFFIDKHLAPILNSGIAPSSLIICWDGGNDYRTALFPDYKKARRDKPRSKIRDEQLQLLRSNSKAFLCYIGCISCTAPGQEADDLMAYFRKKLPNRYITIHSGDSDMLQLVTDEKTLVLRSEEIYQQGSMLDEVPLTLIRLHKAIVGDSADGYTGVPGIGPVKFKELLSAFGEEKLLDLDRSIGEGSWEVLNQLLVEESTQKIVQTMLEHWSDLCMSHELATLQPKACEGRGRNGLINLDWELRVPNREKALKFLDAAKHGYRIDWFDQYFPQHYLMTAEENVEKAADWAAEIMASPVVSYDFESYDPNMFEGLREAAKTKNFVDVMSQKPTGVSVNFGKYAEKTIYLSFDHKDTENLPEDWLRWVMQVLAARDLPTFAQNANFELALSINHQAHFGLIPYDTAIMASYVDENFPARLKEMSNRYLCYKQLSYAETVGEGTMQDISGEDVLQYGCDDSLVTSTLAKFFWLRLDLEGTLGFYEANEVRPTEDDVYNFIGGTDIDVPRLEELQKEGKETAAKADAKVRELLELHASDPDETKHTEAATALLNEWWELEQHKFSQEQMDKAQARYTKLWGEAWELSQYQSHHKTFTPKEFVSTPTNIKKVLELLGYQGPPLEKVTRTGLLTWIADNDELTHGIDSLSHYIKLLSEASARLGANRRDGPEYEALKAESERIFTANEIGTLEESGSELSYGSPKQAAGILYGMLGLPIRRRSKTQLGSTRQKLGLPGSAATGLKAIAAAFVHDIEEGDWRADVLTGYQTIVKHNQNESLYYKPYPLWVNPLTGKIHPQLRNCGTVTRRPTGTSPNVLQVSKQDGAKIRTIYKAPEEHVYLCADFANQELVITACESQDPVMLDAFMSDPRKDLHSVTCTGFAHLLLPRMGATEFSGLVGYDTFIENLHGGEHSAAFGKLRNKYGKGCNFLIAYMGGFTTLAENLLISADLAKTLMSSTFALYPRLKPWQNEVIEFACSHGYVETPYGTRRHLNNDLYSRDDGVRKRMERQTVNFKAQGCAADILKVVRQTMYDKKMRERFKLQAVKPVYDEIAAVVPRAAVAEYAAELTEAMSITPPGYPVGMAVDLSIGPTWGTVDEVDGVEGVSNWLEENKNA